MWGEGREYLDCYSRTLKWSKLVLLRSYWAPNQPRPSLFLILLQLLLCTATTTLTTLTLPFTSEHLTCKLLWWGWLTMVGWTGWCWWRGEGRCSYWTDCDGQHSTVVSWTLWWSHLTSHGRPQSTQSSSFHWGRAPGDLAAAWVRNGRQDVAVRPLQTEVSPHWWRGRRRGRSPGNQSSPVQSHQT